MTRHRSDNLTCDVCRWTDSDVVPCVGGCGRDLHPEGGLHECGQRCIACQGTLCYACGELVEPETYCPACAVVARAELEKEEKPEEKVAA